MNIQSIRLGVNDIHIEDLVSYSLLNESNRQIYAEQGFNLASISKDKVLKKYPFLEEECLYLVNSISTTCVYWDGKQIMFDVPLFCGVDVNEILDIHFCMNGTEEEYIKMKKDAIHMNNKNAISKCISADGLKLDLFLHNLYDYDNVYERFIDLYTSCDFGFSALSNEQVRYIFSKKTDAEKKLTELKLSEFPSKVKVYRGLGDKSLKQGYSWTLDKNIALMFANGFTDEESIILTGFVEKSDIIEYTNERNEEELILLPQSVTITNRDVIYSINEEQLEKAILNKQFLEVITPYHYWLKNYDFDDNISDHTGAHSYRVMILSLLMAKLFYPKLFTKYRDELAMASAFHDIGRTHDGEDNTHGERSVRVLRNEYESVHPFVEFLITYHCKEDSEAQERLKTLNIGKRDKDYLWLLFCILKDADALDRYRFGIHDLDVNYLRLPNSIRLATFAKNAIEGLEF